MIGDQYQPTCGHASPGPVCLHVMVWAGSMPCGAQTDWNKGQVSLLLETDCFERGQDTEALIASPVPDISRRYDPRRRAAPAGPSSHGDIRMNDDTESIRRLQLVEINTQPGSRERGSLKHGQVGTRGS